MQFNLTSKSSSSDGLLFSEYLHFFSKKDFQPWSTLSTSLEVLNSVGSFSTPVEVSPLSSSGYAEALSWIGSDLCTSAKSTQKLFGFPLH